ncbi:MAG: hypothetical protein ACT6FG_07045, partial [Methanosarcinaceae archaeon]
YRRDYKLKCRKNVIVRASGLEMRSLKRIASASKIAKLMPKNESKYKIIAGCTVSGLLDNFENIDKSG